jgi:hypothetical protein
MADIVDGVGNAVVGGLEFFCIFAGIGAGYVVGSEVARISIEEARKYLKEREEKKKAEEAKKE